MKKSKPIAIAIILLFLAISAKGQVPVALLPPPYQQFFTATGLPLSNGCISTFNAGTTTPAATYTDSSGQFQNTNPVILDASGSASIWLANQSYKIQVNAAPATGSCSPSNLGALIRIVDNVTAWQTINLAQQLFLTPSISDPTPATAGELAYRSDLGCFRGFTTVWGCFLSSFSNNTFTANNTFLGSITCTVLNAVRCVSPSNPQGWAGSDVGAWITSASIGCTPCEIDVAAGTYNYSTPIVLNSQVTLRGAGRNVTTLNWVGSTSGVAMNFPSTSANITVQGLQILNGVSAGTTTGIKIINSSGMKFVDVTVQNFKTDLYSTGDGVSQETNGLVITDSFFTGNSTAVNMYFDHTANIVLTNVQVGHSTVANVVFDSGVNGVSVHWLNSFQGNTGLVFKCTGSNGSGSCQSSVSNNLPYDYPPWGMQLDQLIMDAVPGTGDEILFDSTLATNTMDVKITNLWATGGINAVHISGGQKIAFAGGGNVRGSQGNGILIDSANVANLDIADLFIVSNNQANAADKHGIYITAAASEINIHDNRIGNLATAPFEGGHQLFGIKVAANAPNLKIHDNDLTGNSTGPISYSSTAADFVIWNNFPVSTSGITFAAGLPAATNGTFVYCPDCTVANPCAGAGTGALAKRLNGVWVCN